MLKTLRNEPKTWQWSGREKTKERNEKEKLQIRKKLPQSWEGIKRYFVYLCFKLEGETGTNTLNRFMAKL